MAGPRKPPQTQVLGKHTEWPQSPERAVLDRVPNPHPDTHYAARFTAPEFTTLCPVTGQPDFAHLVIDYVPDGWLVESSWNAPWLRNEARKSLSDFDSTSQWLGA